MRSPPSLLRRMAAMLDAMWKTLVSGGALMIPIAVISVTMWILILTRYSHLRTQGEDTEDLVEHFAMEFASRNYREALDLCKGGSGVVKRALREACSRGARTLEELHNYLDDIILREIPALNRHLSFIGALVAVAPLLGLLGTVTGMISTFDVITTSGAGDPKALSAGISVALLTTEAGLVVAIPGLAALGYLLTLSTRARHELERLSARILGLCHEGSASQ
jgi:biopolymer transport protein ExbB